MTAPAFVFYPTTTLGEVAELAALYKGDHLRQMAITVALLTVVKPKVAQAMMEAEAGGLKLVP